jgi:hypothetical protein
MADLSKLLNPNPETGRGRGQVMRGRVKAGPDMLGTIKVAALGFSAEDPYDVPALNWTPRGQGVPSPGNPCMIVIDDLGDVFVPVYGGEMILQVDAQDAVRFADGMIRDTDAIDTTPVISGERAVEIAVQKLGFPGQFAEEPAASLVVLPRAISST